MPLSERAAQFAPFAALTGYAEMIEQAGAFPPVPPDDFNTSSQT